ncbi:hypothetical protein QBC46DRAFT_308223 [Diplogelasinospora grovesii]|uniref:C2H2-type domain-containing protein n=1 Tax=Diplogelasinospora grovesii TaxID=303347 RepID=A0AAN6S7V8_9PEZI|nr:hypothetical protein QBC46DRAFT_308223 [Diplogelasinospora grovesii]
MKRKATDEAGPESPSKRPQLAAAAADDNDDSAETESVFADSVTSPPPTATQTLAATSVTGTRTSFSRASRKFPSDLKTIKCTYTGCPKTFNRPARLAAHLRSHTNDRPFKCPFDGCGKDYLEEKHLTQHIKGSHTHERKYTCTEPGCEKSFVTATRLRRHAAVHEGAERYRCRDYPGCTQSFRKHQTLQRHIRVAHLGLSPYPCGNDGCQSGFETAGQLKRHVEREHGELKFWCDECSQHNDDGDDDDGGRKVGFTTLLLLQSHVRREHMNCIFCDVKCGTQGDVERHIDLYHSGTPVEARKTISCTWEGCDKKFTRVSNLNTHIKTAHQGQRFVCGEVDTHETEDIKDWNWREEGCGEHFVSRMKLEEHVRFIHLGRKRPPKLYTPLTSITTAAAAAAAAAANRNICCTEPGCVARFIRYSDLERHLRGKNIHTYMNENDEGGNGNGNGYGEQDYEVLFADATPKKVQSTSIVPAIDPKLELLQQEGQLETEWADMRRLLDVDALVQEQQ